MALRNAVALGHSHLYHYQTFNADYLQEIIVGGAIYFSKPSDFNDPWDCRPFFDYECISDPDMREHHIQWYIETTKKHRPDITLDEMNRMANVYRNDPKLLASKIREFSEALSSAVDEQYRVYCLTPRFDSELMWAHYTSKHRGICLEFATRNELFCSALPVRYAENYPRFYMTDFAGPEENIAPLLSKSAAWSYEQEFRLISDERGNPHDCIVTTDGKVATPPTSL